MRGGALRHVITLQSQAEVADGNGDVSLAWTDFATNVPASYLSGPGREFMAAEAIRAEIPGRFEIRYMAGVTAKMRVVWDGQVFNMKAPPAVDATGRRSMILMVGSGVNSG